MGLIYGAYYYGLPEDQKEALEGVAQATVNRLFLLSDRIKNVAMTAPTFFGDADYKISQTDNELHYTDISAGWWAVIQIVHDRSGLRFRVFARQGEMPSPLPTWKQLEEEFLYGRADLYLDVLRSEDGSWYGPLHLINYQHPLLLNLQNAVNEIEKGDT